MPFNVGYQLSQLGRDGCIANQQTPTVFIDGASLDRTARELGQQVRDALELALRLADQCAQLLHGG